MRHQANPWITSNLWLLSAAMLPAIVLVGALLYFTGWAFTFSFTDLGLTGRKAVEWSEKTGSASRAPHKQARRQA